MKRIALALAILTSCGFAADVPKEPIADKGKQLVADDFSRTELGAWKPLVPSAVVADGMLKVFQTRADHGAVCRYYMNFKDLVLEFRFRLAGPQTLNIAFDDANWKDKSHAGHICRAAISPGKIRLQDDCEGAMRKDIEEMRKDPSKKKEVEKLLAGRSASADFQFEQNRWYQVHLEMIGDRMLVAIDGKTLCHLKSPGIDHPTKTSLHFTVNGKEIHFDDVNIWEAIPHTPKASE